MTKITAAAEHQPEGVGVAPEQRRCSPGSCEATAMAASRPTNIAAPPTVGVGRSWTRRSSGMTMIEKRTARRRTTNVASQVTTAATTPTIR